MGESGGGEGWSPDWSEMPVLSTSMGGAVHIVYFIFFCEHFTKGHKFYEYFPCFYPIFPIALWDPHSTEKGGAQGAVRSTNLSKVTQP